MPASDLNASITKVQNEFTLKLLRELLADCSASVVVSPPAVAVTLALVLAGAKDKTSEQMSQLLAKGTPKYRILPHFGALSNAIHGGGKKFAKFTIESANKLCLKADIPVEDAYKAGIEKYFGAQLELVDFGQNMKQVLATTTKVNKIVLDATHGMVQEVLKPEAFNSHTELLLLSAFYFKGKWAEKFDPDLTQKKAFNTTETTQKEVFMMHKTHIFDYYEDPLMQILVMPCDELAMFIMLPKEQHGLQNLLANLTADVLLELAQNCKKVKVNVAVPKFKLEYLAELNQPLKKLGLVNAFENANLGGIVAQGPLAITKVLQKAVLEVSEDGGTGTSGEQAAGLISPTAPPPKFVADHPFAIFLISQQSNPMLIACGIFQG